jgi:alpha-ribazole phosphatase
MPRASMKCLAFIRHAECVANAGGITMPAPFPLSELGRQQARALAGTLELEPSTILVSGLLRAQQTAAPFCQRFAMHPVENPMLDEFAVIDPDLIEGLDAVRRHPFTQAYWQDPDPHRRLGKAADTFAEFNRRVEGFIEALAALPNATVIFGHGIWFSLLTWRLRGHRANDAKDMRCFWGFQLGAPIPNGAMFRLTQTGKASWSVQPVSTAPGAQAVAQTSM